MTEASENAETTKPDEPFIVNGADYYSAFGHDQIMGIINGPRPTQFKKPDDIKNYESFKRQLKSQYETYGTLDKAEHESLQRIFKLNGDEVNQKDALYVKQQNALKDKIDLHARKYDIQNRVIFDMEALPQPAKFPEMGSHVSYAALAAVIASVVLPGIMRMDATGVMNSLNGALTGLAEGNEIRFKEEMRLYDRGMEQMKLKGKRWINDIDKLLDRKDLDSEMLNIEFKQLALINGEKINQEFLTRQEIAKKRDVASRILETLVKRHLQILEKVPGKETKKKDSINPFAPGALPGAAPAKPTGKKNSLGEWILEKLTPPATGGSTSGGGEEPSPWER